MLNRIFATIIFVVLHILFYVIFKQFLTGTAFAMAVYGCTLVTFVILDAFLIKLKRGKQKHAKIDTE